MSAPKSVEVDIGTRLVFSGIKVLVRNIDLVSEAGIITITISAQDEKSLRDQYTMAVTLWDKITHFFPRAADG